MNDVYVLTRNEDSEGGSVIGVFTSLVAAKKAGKKSVPNGTFFEAGRWEQCGGYDWRMDFSPIDYMYLEWFKVDAFPNTQLGAAPEFA